MSNATRYDDVKQVLRGRIASGLYPRGEKLPTGMELTREFNVSEITVRRALKDLQVEGLVQGRQGAGVFVSDEPRIHRPLNPAFIKSLGDEMRRASFAPGLRVLSFELVDPPEPIATELGLAAGEQAYRHQRVILADDHAVGLDTTYLPRAVGEVVGPEMDREFLMPLLDQHGIAYRDVIYRLKATALSWADAGKLELQPGLPMLSMVFKPIDEQGRPIFLGHLLTRAEWFSFEFSVSHARAEQSSRSKRKPGEAASDGGSA